MFTGIDVDRLKSRASSVRVAITSVDRATHCECPDQSLAELADVVCALCSYIDQLRQDMDNLKHGVITR
jgi:hypothetical protein